MSEDSDTAFLCLWALYSSQSGFTCAHDRLGAVDDRAKQKESVALLLRTSIATGEFL